MKSLEQLIQTTVKRMMPVQAFTGKVVSVDKDNNTCMVDDEGLELQCRLVSAVDGSDQVLVIYPAIESLVTCLILNNDAAQCQVIGYTRIDEVYLGGNENGGLTITPELKSQLDVMTARIDTIIDAITNAAVAPADGGATFKANMIATLEGNTDKEDFSEIENDKVKH